jgi:CheY-like chemotaxis protein
MLLTDVAMPGMTGPELTERLLPGRPDLRVLYMSAYLDESEVGAGAPDRGIVFLQKPFSPATLGRTVRAILDVPPGAARPARRG